MTAFEQMAILKFLPDEIEENIFLVVGESSCLLITSILKKALDHLISNPMSPIQNLYDNHLVKTIYVPVHNLQPLTLGLQGVVIFIDTFAGFSSALKRISISKFRLDAFGEMTVEGGGV